MGAILQQKTDKMGTASYITLFETMSTMHSVEYGGQGVRWEERSSTLGVLPEVSIEWPENVKLYTKLRFEGEARLGEDDWKWLIELSEVTGWELGDVVDEVYASLKRTPVIHWCRGKIENFITNNVETRYRGLFRTLVDKTIVLHEHFYEGHLDTRSFEERWSELLKTTREG